ncbi:MULTISPECIES: NUDIX hydrolase [Bosea]|uniref:NUDIX hydrolase n=1 Tax=Bosea TaxID=85413 RepID=UPI0027E2B075|nr:MULTISPECIES: NUDIX hydrolase [Bosea]MDR6826771.1 ADP-ribose pyrophosphatase [Bosea robiniae]MDR7136820.1 ADP-ribose pyrophosphatase [Bosea sp. BE168]MDR7173519.1 ADP-ribose pyrophosphatase [Bosea sp. BE271]
MDVASAGKPEIETLSSRVVYQNRWMTVREDAIRRRDGSQGIYGVVEKTDFAAIVPVEPDGSIHLVEQYRHPVGARFWEVPQGSWESNPEADPLTVAQGELREETGLQAADMVKLGYLFECYGYSNQGCHVFLARGLTQQNRDLDHEEQGLISRRFPASDVMAMIQSGQIRDAITVAAIGLLVMRGLLPQAGDSST